MDMVTYAGIFLLGAVALCLIGRVWSRCIYRPSAKDLDEEFLQRIAKALR